MYGAMTYATNGLISSPLWDFPPAFRPAVLHERRVRGLMQWDPEPMGDVEFT